MNIAYGDYEINGNNNETNTEQTTLFPPLKDERLWQQTDSLSFPEDHGHEQQYEYQDIQYTNTIAQRENSHSNNSSCGNQPQTPQQQQSEDSSVFNISWGGNDKPPSELHPGEEEDEPMKLSRPLPKPRGIRKLPEPEPSEDGTIDEDTLRRRKNTDAARRSRMKKLLKTDQLESRVAALQAENAQLVLNNAVLESEKRSQTAKEVEYKKRIKYLEDIIKQNGFQTTTPPTPAATQLPSSNESVGTVERWLVHATEEMKY
ncbi:hypothetical protein K501DRAFT_256666 [Backusella circina FSU 941]|nr:hypothetical protein K501DRAFT_256666 [Backusella circina FSU 941]